MNKELQDLRDAFVGAMLAHKWALGALIAASPEAAARLLSVTPDEMDEWLQSKALPDASIAAARAEIDGMQRRARQIMDSSS